MPTSTHDICTELIVQEIASQLKSVAREDTDIAAVLDLVRSESSSDVYLYGHEAIDERLKDIHMLPTVVPNARIMRYGYESQW